jgi:hypothetical protein
LVLIESRPYGSRALNGATRNGRGPKVGHRKVTSENSHGPRRLSGNRISAPAAVQTR